MPLAVIFPGVMHGLYGAFSAYTVSFLLAFVTVYLMNNYPTAGKEMPAEVPAG